MSDKAFDLFKTHIAPKTDHHKRVGRVWNEYARVLKCANIRSLPFSWAKCALVMHKLVSDRS